MRAGLIRCSCSILVILIGSVFLSLSCSKKEEGIIVAEAGGEKLTAEELDRLIEESKERTPKVYRHMVTPESVMDEWIEFQLLAQEGLNRNYDDDPEVKKKVEEYLKRKVVAKLWEEEIEKKVTDASEEEVRKFYEEIKDRDYKLSKEKVRLRVIATKSILEAKNLKKRAMNGEDFAELAREYSIRMDNKEAGGDMGYRARSELPNEVSSVVFNLNEGEITDPIKLEVGFSIFQVVDRLGVGDYIPFDYVKEQLENRYLVEMKKKAASDFLERLKEENQPIKYLSRYNDYLNEKYKKSKNDGER